MKLRLRSLETKETLKMEVPDPCSLQHLRELVSQNFHSPLYFSLNRKDELTTCPDESIQSIGITSGDLIYFTTNPNGFSAGPQVIPPVAPSVPKSEQSQKSQTLNPNSEKQDETLNARSRETLDLNSGKGETVGFINPNSEDVVESREIDDGRSSVSEVGKSFSVPGFLRKVFKEELGDDDGLNHKLLGIAVRAVLLESGFVEIDPASNMLKGNNFDLQGSWYLASFYYTLQDIISRGNVETGVTNSVKIKFQNLGKYCKVYGSLVNGTGVHWVLLDEDKLVPFLNVVWANCGQIVETMEENNRVSSVLPEKEVFEFWRKVKDGLALPLLIDLCEESGLELPPCFMRLPTELKLKILESVSGVDVAKVSCACSELRYLASSEDLWKQKYVEQFGNVEGSEGGRTFKERFARAWEGRERRKVAGRSFFSIGRRNPYAPFGPIHFLGGDYDPLPSLGRLGWPGGGGPRPRNAMTKTICNLGVAAAVPAVRPVSVCNIGREAFEPFRHSQ